MNQREKILAASVAFLVGLMVARMGWNKIDRLYDQRGQQLSSLEKTVRDRQLDVERGKMAAERLNQWQRQSLPADPNLAQTLYQDWLRRQLDAAGFQNVEYRGQGSTARSRRVRRSAYRQLSFTVDGRGSLEQLTQFLYEFYRADHLHQLQSLDVEPIEDSDQLDLIFKIEALILPGADRVDALSSGTSDRLAQDDLSSYQETIVTRNLFARYAPPSPPTTAGDSADAAPQAIITGITHDENGWQAWVYIKTTKKMLRLHPGDPFEIGGLSGTIIRIGPREVVFETDGRRMLAGEGASLRDAIELTEDDS